MPPANKAAMLALLTVGLGVLAAPFGRGWEESFGLSGLFRLRGTRAAPPEVVIVTPDQTSAERLHLPTDIRKWPRSVHARLVERLARAGAAVIAFDVVFSEPRDVNGDAAFAEAVAAAGNVVLCKGLDRAIHAVADPAGDEVVEVHVETELPLLPSLVSAAAATAPWPLPKLPVQVRDYWTFKAAAGDAPTLPVVAFQVYALDVYGRFVRLLEEAGARGATSLPRTREQVLEGKVERLAQDIRRILRGDQGVAAQMREAGGREAAPEGREDRLLMALVGLYGGESVRYLNFYGPPGTFTTLNYAEVLTDGPSGEGEFEFRGKAVFVGLSQRMWPRQRDSFHTVYSQPSGLDLSGVEVAATAFANLLEEMPVRPLSRGAHLAILVGWGALVGVLCWTFRPLVSAALIAALGALYATLALDQFRQAGIWFPLATPFVAQVPFAFFAALGWKYWDARRQRHALRAAFAHYLPPAVVDELSEDLAAIRGRGRIVYGVCLLSDADQYTALSERLDPSELGRLMNRYYGAVFEPVRRHGGTVVDVRGDSMLALWTAEAPDASVRRRACEAALGIGAAVQKFGRDDERFRLGTRLGLHAGTLSLGSVGALDHFEYRPVGDIVNTASRIEGLNKVLGTRTLVSGEVLEGLSGFAARALGSFLLAGKTQPVRIAELRPSAGAIPEGDREADALFEEALGLYQAGAWDEAKRLFETVLGMRPDDGPSLFYLELCKGFLNRPPTDPWDGTVRLETK